MELSISFAHEETPLFAEVRVMEHVGAARSAGDTTTTSKGRSTQGRNTRTGGADGLVGGRSAKHRSLLRSSRLEPSSLADVLQTTKPNYCTNSTTGCTTTNKQRADTGWSGDSSTRRPIGTTTGSTWLMRMAVFASLIVLGSCFVGYHGKLVSTPPRLTRQPPSEFWYHLPSTGNPTKFTLECQANGDAEKYQWLRNGLALPIDGKRVVWQKPGQSGTIVFLHPTPEDQAYYQCYVSNIFGTAVSNRVHVQMGVLDIFSKRSLQTVTANVGDSLTLKCAKPAGTPEPRLFWLFRDEKQSHVIETISRRHISVDGEGNLRFSNVKEHDGRSNLIYQCAATSPVLQGEYRTGDEFKVVAVKRRYTPPQKAEIMWSSPEAVKVNAGTKLKLMCIFSGYPTPEILWSKEGGDLPMDRLVDFGRVDFGKSLVVDPVHPSDAGTYVCRSMGNYRRMTVTVTAAPYWVTGPPKDVSLPEEATSELKCDADGDPTPVVVWYKNGQSLDELEPNARRVTLDGGRVLRIADLNHDVDMGVYQCNASNAFGYVFANAFVNVKAHVPLFSTPMDQTFKITTGSSLSLDCVVEAAPAPVVRWVDKNNQQIQHDKGRLQLFANNTLRLNSVGFADAKAYYCNVSNKYGINRARYEVQVYDPTFFTNVSGAEPRVLQAFDSTELFCEAKSDPRLTIGYSWLKDDKPLDTQSLHYRLLQPNRLQLHRVRGRHTGFYKCVARTDVDTQVSDTRIVVKDVPEAPIVTSVECDQRMATIKWTAAYDNAVPVTAYTVELATSFRPNVWRPIIFEEKLDNRTRFEGQISLSPWVNYTFGVVAENARGRGAAGRKALAVCNTRATFPYANPANVSAQGLTPDTLMIRWQPMDKEDWNADRLVYVVSYRLDQPGEEWIQFDIEDPQQDHVIIRDQPTFRQYLVKVRAKNVIGQSIIDPDAVVGYSGESEPTEAPGSFDHEIVNSTTVRFFWNHVNPDNVMGHFQGYRLQAWEAPRVHGHVRRAAKASARLLVDVLVPSDAKSVVLAAFEPMSSYVAQVALLFKESQGLIAKRHVLVNAGNESAAQVLAENKEYQGPPSAQISIKTPEGVPSQVTSLSVSPVGAHTILVQWQPPAIRNGNLQGYYLTFTKLNVNDSSSEAAATSYDRQKTGISQETTPHPEFYEAYILSDRTHYVYPTAAARTAYEVRVWANTGGGMGPQLAANVTTWPVQAPGKPQFHLDVKSATSAKIDWLPPLDAMPGSGFYLNYSIKGQPAEWHRERTVDTPGRSFTLTGLRPDTEYVVRLVAVDGRLSSESEPRSFTTDRLARAPDVSAQGVTGVAWFIAVVCSVAVALISVLVVCVCQRSKSGKYPVKQKEMERGYDANKEKERTFMEYQYGNEYSKETT